MSSLFFRPSKTLTSLLYYYYFSFLNESRYLLSGCLTLIAYLLAVPGALPAPPACVCMNLDEDGVTGFGGQCYEDIKSVYYYYHVECLFIFFFLSARDS